MSCIFFLVHELAMLLDIVFLNCIFLIFPVGKKPKVKIIMWLTLANNHNIKAIV